MKIFPCPIVPIVWAGQWKGKTNLNCRTSRNHFWDWDKLMLTVSSWFIFVTNMNHENTVNITHIIITMIFWQSYFDTDNSKKVSLISDFWRVTQILFSFSPKMFSTNFDTLPIPTPLVKSILNFELWTFQQQWHIQITQRTQTWISIESTA